MEITRTLEKNGKTQSWTLGGALTPQDLVEQSSARIKQGWKPVNAPKDVAPLIDALKATGLDIYQWVMALSDEEVEVAYAQAIRDAELVSVDTLRRRPSRALFGYQLSRFDRYDEAQLTRAVKFLSKDPEAAAWINEELQKSLAKPVNERAKKFAERNSAKLAAGPAPEPAAPAKPAGNEAGLLQAIAADPFSDTPRFVYADWLTEQGSAWGELIHA